MLLLDISGQLNTLLTWIKELRFIICAVVGIVMVIRITVLWMSARDKRTAIEETLWWVGALVFLALAPEVLDEVMALFGVR